MSDKIKKFLNKNDFITAVLVGVFVISLSLILGWYNNKVVPVNSDKKAHYTLEPNNPLSFMSNWDGPSYISISKSGYTTVTQTNYFPLYPLLTSWINKIIPSALDSALLISWLSFVGAIYFYIKILKLLFKKNNLSYLEALFFFVFYPAAIFLMATYTEPLLCFLALAAIYFALKKKFIYSAVFLLFATATHITGVLAVGFVALILFEEKQKIINIVATVLIGLVGILSYSYYLLVRFNSPLAFIKSQVTNHSWLTGNYLHLITGISAVDLFFIILVILSVIYWWNKRISFAIYSLSFLIIPLVGRHYGGFARYSLLDFPIQLMLYSYLKNKKLSYLVVSILLVVSWAYFVLQYTGGYVGG